MTRWRSNRPAEPGGAGRRVAAGVAAIAALAAAVSLALVDLRGSAADELLQVRDSGRPVSERVVVVEVDEQIVKEEGLPLPRALYGQAIRRLDALGAAAVVVDVQFTELSQIETEDDPRDSLALLEAIEQTDAPVILGTSEVVDAAHESLVLGGAQNLEPAGAVAANATLPIAADDRWRRIEPVTNGLRTMAQAASLAARGPAVPKEGALIDPTVPADRVESVGFSDLVSGDVDRREIAGRVAVIGVTVVGPTGSDRGLVAGSTGPQFGVFVHAQGIDTALRGSPLKAAGWLSALLALLSVATSAVAVTLRAAWKHLVLLGGIAVLVVVVSVIAVRAGLLVDPVPAGFALLAGGIAGIGARAAVERGRRTRARSSLARFVPPAVVDELMAEGSDGRLAPKLQTATIVFCDLRGYTALVSHLPRPEALAEVLDAYLGEVTAVIHAHGGTVVSFQGDGVMSAFGAPVPSDDAPARAVAAARAMLDEALPRVAARMRELVPDAATPALGVGIATGEVLAGTVGPAARREYAVVGSPTNLAARLQAQSKLEPSPVVIDGATARAAGAVTGTHTGVRTEAAELRLLGNRQIRGLDEPVECWTLT